MDTIRPEIDRPAAYRASDRREWIVSDEPETAGLAILVRTSITVAEQRDLQEAHDLIVGRHSEEWDTTPPEDRDVAISPLSREKALLAPHILDWNVTAPNVSGEIVEIAAPAVNGPLAFDYISNVERRWITTIVLIGYLATGKALPSLPASMRSGATSMPEEPAPPETPAPTSPPRRKKSPTPSASALTT